MERVAADLGWARAKPLDADAYWQVAEALFDVDHAYARFTAGEWSHACFVRSVLDPVRILPASALPRKPPADEAS